MSLSKYNAIETPAVQIAAKKNNSNTITQFAAYFIFFLFIFQLVTSLLVNVNSILWLTSIWMLPVSIFFGYYTANWIPQAVKITPEGGAWIAFGTRKAPMFFTELTVAVVRDATEEDLIPKGCCNSSGYSWCESRTVDTSIVIAGTSKSSGKPVFYTVPRSPELTALVAGAVANKL